MVAHDKGFRPTPTFWGEKLPFGTVCGEFASPAGGWVHTVSFSPSGDVLAFAGKPASFVSTGTMLSALVKAMIAPSASFILDLVQQSVPSEYQLSLSSLSYGPLRTLSLLLVTTVSLTSSPETKVDGSSSAVSTTHPLLNPLLVLPGSALVGPEG